MSALGHFPATVKFLSAPAVTVQRLFDRRFVYGYEGLRCFKTHNWNFTSEATPESTAIDKTKVKKTKLPASAVAATALAKTASKKPVSQSAQLTKYILSTRLSENDAKLLGKTKFARVKRETGESLCLINDDVASSIADLCQPYTSDADTTVIEFNPGLGLLTSQLKSKLGLKNINCFEAKEEFVEHLKTTLPGDINIIETNFLTFPRLHHLDKLDGGCRVYTALGSVKNNSKEDVAAATSVNDKLYVFGATPEIDFINFTIKSLVTQKMVFEEDSNVWQNRNVTYFLALGTRAYTIINATSELGFTVYRASSILFQLLFNYVVLGHVSRRAFVPWENSLTKTRKSSSASDSGSKKSDTGDAEAKKRKKRVPTIPHDPESMCIIKFSPNQQNIDKIGKNNLFTFWYFVRHHLFARSNCVIPELEQWIPGCGPKLIRKGFTIYTQFGSLTPQQILDIYLDFSSWPEFKSSSFLNAVEKYQHKVDTHEEDMLNFSKNPRF